MHAHAPSRRRLLKAAFASPTLSLAAPFLGSLATMGSAHAAGQGGYKALVCIFLEGGNDHWNTIVPYDEPSYRKYASLRCGTPSPTGTGTYRGIGLLRDRLLPLSPRLGSPDQGGFQFALHPAMPNIREMFNAGRASIALNMGPLVTRSTSERDFWSGVNVPPRLFSHNDQQSLTQSIVGTEGARSGWGGRVMDTFGADPLGCIAVGGLPNSVFLSGNASAFPFGIDPMSAPTLPAFTGAEEACYRTLMSADRYSNPLMRDLCLVNGRAYESAATLAAQMQAGASRIDDHFAGVDSEDDDIANPLAQRLRMVARLINANQGSARRQVFLVGMGGFDLHDGLVQRHPLALGRIDQAVKRFFDALESVGAASKVTAFTASDFGRTLWSNGDGSDHGWGSHHFVFSGDPDFLGGHLTGTAPDITSWTRGSQAGKGRLIPTTSLEQFAWPLARWFGVGGAGDVDRLFPNHAEFDMDRIRLFR